jgi:hypothetical protein
VEHLKDATLGQAQALTARIRLGCTGKEGTNTLAFYEHPQITPVKSLILLALELTLEGTPASSNFKPLYQMLDWHEHFFARHKHPSLFCSGVSDKVNMFFFVGINFFP